MKQGYTSNAQKHLKDIHEERMDTTKNEEEEEQRVGKLSWRRICDGFIFQLSHFEFCFNAAIKPNVRKGARVTG